jgi:hypothetical protein
VSIVIRYIEPHTYPVILCDACDERIEDPALGAVLYSNREGAEDRNPYFVHKSVCHDALEPIVAAGGLAEWHELSTWLISLLAQTGLQGTTLKQAIERASHESR